MTHQRMYVKIQVPLPTKILVRSDSCVIVRNSLLCTKWSPMYEMIFVRNDLTPILYLKGVLLSKRKCYTRPIISG